MFKNYLKGVEGIADYPVISLVIFFLFFLATLAWWLHVDKIQLDKMSKMPLEDSIKSNNEKDK